MTVGMEKGKWDQGDRGRATTPPQGEDKPSPIRTNLSIGELFCLEGEHLSRHSRFLLAGEIRLPTIISMPGCLLSEPRLGRSVGWCS
jgi:hypothetical protein